MIVALMSTYREGRLALSAARSALAAADALIVLEGPIGPAAPGGDPTPLRDIELLGTDTNLVWTEEGVWDSDAHKRTALLHWAQETCGQDTSVPLWCFWIDGDEILLWGEYLPDLIDRASHVSAIGGMPLRIVELDGSVAFGHGRVFDARNLRTFVEGSYQAQLTSGMIVSLPNEHLCVAGGVPVANQDGSPVTVDDLMVKRPPLAGEPHILHRSILRSPERTARRIHEDETAFYAEGGAS